MGFNSLRFWPLPGGHVHNLPFKFVHGLLAIPKKLAPDDSAWDFFIFHQKEFQTAIYFKANHASNVVKNLTLRNYFPDSLKVMFLTDSTTGFITINSHHHLGSYFFWNLFQLHRVQSRIPRFFRIFPLKSRSHFSRGKFLIFCAEVLKVICPSSPNWLKPRCSWACGMRFV